MHTKSSASFLYLLLATLFTGTLITCNLIANKFFEVQIGSLVIPLSAGVLPYPLTFLITDILSEFYGVQRTNRVVFSGFIVSLVVLGILALGASVDAAEYSILSNEDYDKAFSNQWRIVAASMTAYLVAQLVDIRIFHFWKRLTKGKHLWLRNNASTIFSQLLDSSLVVLVLFVGLQTWEWIFVTIFSSWLFKLICALVDTPILYAAAFFIRKHLGLKPGEEIPVDA